MTAIQLLEVVQAGDIFLCAFRCPECSQRCMSDFGELSCDQCQKDFLDCPVVLPTAARSRRVLTGTRRKNQISKRLVQQILEEQNRECAYCYSSLVEYHLEHIIPISVGGTNNKGNLCISCPRCNLLAGSWVFPNFHQKQAFIQMRRTRKAA